MQKHEAAAADIAAAGIDDGLCISNRDGSINGVAALFQDPKTHIASNMLRGHDHAMPRSRSAGSGARLCWKTRRQHSKCEEQNRSQMEKKFSPSRLNSHGAFHALFYSI
jgi:hypothetical protein